MKVDTQGKKLGPIWFAPGVSYANAAVGLYASFTTINLLIYMNFIQPYILIELLDVPADEQGSVTGRLAALQEAVIIVFMAFIGAMSDQWGRRTVSSPLIILRCFKGTLAITAPLRRHKEQLHRRKSSKPFSSSTSNSTAPQWQLAFRIFATAKPPKKKLGL